jgi:hypothetical protein
MVRRPPLTRRVASLVACLALATALVACDRGDSATSSGTSTSTRRHQRRGSTTTTSAATTTTLGGAQPDTPVTDPNAPSTTTTPAGGAPCGAQEARLAAVVTGGELTGVPVDRYTVTDCRLASSNLIWAAATLVPKPGASVPRLTVVFERIGSIWTVHSYGSDPTGCDAPAPVPAELALGC